MASTPSPAPGSRLRSLLIVLACAIAGALLFALAGPRTAPLGPARGDETLARDLRAALDRPDGYPAVSAARLSGGKVTWAGFGDVTADSRFELGSITKTFDGLLLADATQRGEVKLTDRLDAHLPELAGTPVGEVTLEELASHRSGLPSLARTDWAAIVVQDLAGAALSDYTSSTPASLIEQVRTVPLTGRGTMQYSNLGAALLGQALTRAAGVPDWPTLVHTRVFDRLGMTATHIAPAGSPAPDLMQPHQSNGHAIEPWTGLGYAPAGLGVTTTASDLARYAQAILDGKAPGMSALDPRWPTSIPGNEIGLAWMVASPDDRPVVWHNGGTGGTRTALMIDRKAGTAALVLTNTSVDVTGTAARLVHRPEAWSLPPMPVDTDTVGWVAIGLVVVLVAAWAAVLGRSRTRIVGQLLGAAGAVLLWWIAAPWDWSPAWLFGAALGLTVGGVVATVLRWGSLPWRPPRRAWLAVVAGVLGVAWFAAMVAVAVAVGVAASSVA
ncbi:serine hydrolase domain-containing protein [Nigerium massiliense]|uniref:serine hydrolase domain-containing protein n=1 Tax=Nigerium massiliense TaxID=1522317 RepID=UPI000693AA33|nr:serine hydrolase domain-containing protein [Nigerium massiliense]